MPNNEVPISSFQDATGINEADKVTGLKNGVNTNFSFSTILSWFVQTVAAAFVPVSRKVNNKALSADISLDASDVGAQAAITASGILKGDGAGGVSAATAGTDYATPGMIPSVPSPSDSAPQDLASTAAAGSSGYYSRADHTHKLPSAADVGAISTNDKGTAGGVATLGNDGKVPSAQLPAIASTAADVTYDNTQSGLTADDVQEAIDELAAGGSATGKADEDTIAPVEDTTTATEAHALGSIFYLNGVLYRALSDIAIGGTINTGAGGNATQTKISENFKRTVTLTSAQYAQLSAAEKAADIVYIITDEPPPAISTSTPQMDGTAAAGSTGEVSDAGHVHPSDTTKANQSQLATVETGSTASRAYAVGEYFCWNGLLYRVISAISSGGTFTPGTNCEQTTISKMAEYWLDVTSQFSTASSATLKVLVNPSIRTVKLFFLDNGLSNGSTAVTIPTQYAPDTSKLVYVSSTDSYRIGIFHGRFTQTPNSFGNIYEFHSFLRYYSGNRQIAVYYPLANPAYAVTFDIEYVY